MEKWLGQMVISMKVIGKMMRKMNKKCYHYNNISKYSNPKLGYEAICDAYEGLRQLEMGHQVKCDHYRRIY